MGKPVEAAGAVQERGTPLGERFLEAIGLKTHEPVVEVGHPGYCMRTVIQRTRPCFFKTIALTSNNSVRRCVGWVLLASAFVALEACMCVVWLDRCSSNSPLGLHAKSHDAHLVVAVSCS